MNRFLLFIFFCIIPTAFVFAQNQGVSDFHWFVYEIEMEGNTLQNPQNPQLNTALTFDGSSNLATADLCCGGSFSFDFTDSPETETLEISNFSSAQANCEQAANNSFAQAISSFFENQDEAGFSYTLNVQNSLTAILQIENSNGGVLKLRNTPLSVVDILVEEDDWLLVALSSYEVSEEDDFSTSFYYDGSFEARICDTLRGSYSTDYEGRFMVRCQDLNFPSEPSCEEQNISELQEAYFNFFTDNNTAKMSIQLTYVDGGDFPCDKKFILIETSNGEGAFFTNCKSNLSTAKEEKESLRVFPNPTAGKVFVSGLRQTETTDVLVYDMTGKKIRKKQRVRNSIDLTGLPAGTYFLKFKTEGRSFTKRVLKE